MRNVILAVVVLSFLVVGVKSGYCARGKKKEVAPAKKQEANVLPEPAAPEQIQQDLKIPQEKEKKAKEKLGAREWTVYLISKAAKKTKQEADILTFSEGKLTSKNLSAKGYLSSNYTVTIQDDNTVVWETMQSTEKGDMAFWRGELRDETMRGILSLHPEKGEAQDSSFTNKISEEQKPQIQELPKAEAKEVKPGDKKGK